MPTRREILVNMLSAPIAAALVAQPRAPASALPEIISEPHCLSEESARGFRLLLQRNRQILNGPSPRLIIIPATRQLSRETGRQLLRQVIGGAWLILESGLAFVPHNEAMGQIRRLRDAFGLELQAPLASEGAYIEYVWPLRRLVRNFTTFTPINCLRTERVAELGGVAVCAKRLVGKGGIIFLGSILGPGLLAEEREAHELGSAMLRSL
jgi:hypothetical protein